MQFERVKFQPFRDTVKQTLSSESYFIVTHQLQCTDKNGTVQLLKLTRERMAQHVEGKLTFNEREYHGEVIKYKAREKKDMKVNRNCKKQAANNENIKPLHVTSKKGNQRHKLDHKPLSTK